MSGTRAATIATAVAGLALLGPGCVARVITESVCGDGRLSPGDVCLGQGPRSQLSIVGIAPLSLRVADFDGAGGPDLLVMGTDGSGAVAGLLYLGDGDGGFAPPFDPGVTGCSAHPVPGRLDDDAFSDLIVDDCTPTVSIYRGSATGRFQAPLSVYTGVGTHSSGLLDLDDDGLREVVLLGALESGAAALSVSEIDASGAFAGPVISELPSPVGVHPGGFGILSLDDGDAFPDALLVAGGMPDALAISRGQEGLRFSAPVPVTPAGLVVDWATPRDLDGDGTPEVLAGSYTEQALIVLDLGTERLEERVRTEVPGFQPSAAGIEDLDGDGVLDLVRAEPGAANLQAWLGDSDGRFDGPTIVELDAPVDQLVLADFDGDGAIDVATGTFDSGTIRVLLSDP